jgi:hypothetical protein
MRRLPTPAGALSLSGSSLARLTFSLAQLVPETAQGRLALNKLCVVKYFSSTPDPSIGGVRFSTPEEAMKTDNFTYRAAIGVVLATGLILLAPLLAMHFTDEVAWTLPDFVIAGALLLGAGLLFVLAARMAGNIAYRAAVGVAVATALLLVWTNLAVGLIGSEDEPANLMYLGVLAVGFIGAGIARLEPQGMARALFVTALAQALVAAIALVAGMHRYPGSSVAEIVNANAFFVALWVGSALLFRRAGTTGSNPVQAAGEDV